MEKSMSDTANGFPFPKSRPNARRKLQASFDLRAQVKNLQDQLRLAIETLVSTKVLPPHLFETLKNTIEHK